MTMLALRSGRMQGEECLFPLHSIQIDSIEMLPPEVRR
jgi:hypothetical protein